jgi:hypothetical protein
VFDPQAPLWFYKLNSGPQRGLGSFRLDWDDALRATVDVTQCGNGQNIPCPTLGYIKHLGEMFDGDLGLPVTANADIVGPVGGFGWKFELDAGAPKSLRFTFVEVDPGSPMIFSIAYPPQTSFTIVASTQYCNANVSPDYTCSETFHQVDSVQLVRQSLGNTYHVDANGLLTIRLIQTPKTYIGRPEFFLPDYTDVGRGGVGFALNRFEREGIRLPKFDWGTYLTVEANCTSVDGVYCSDVPIFVTSSVCEAGFVQVAYDACVSGSQKMFADGSKITLETAT